MRAPATPPYCPPNPSLTTPPPSPTLTTTFLNWWSSQVSADCFVILPAQRYPTNIHILCILEDVETYKFIIFNVKEDYFRPEMCTLSRLNDLCKIRTSKMSDTIEVTFGMLICKMNSLRCSITERISQVARMKWLLVSTFISRVCICCRESQVQWIFPSKGHVYKLQEKGSSIYNLT